MGDPYTESLLLIAAVEVKAGDGDLMEATTQLAVWIAACLRCRTALAKKANHGKSMSEVPIFGWIAIGHTWNLYAGYEADNADGTPVVNPSLIVQLSALSGLTFFQQHIVGPIKNNTLLTDTYEGICKLHFMMHKIAKYYFDVYWPLMEKHILKPLCDVPASDISADEGLIV